LIPILSKTTYLIIPFTEIKNVDGCDAKKLTLLRKDLGNYMWKYLADAGTSS